MALTLSHGGDTIFSTATRSEEVLVGTKEGIVFLKRNGGGSGWSIARRAVEPGRDGSRCDDVPAKEPRLRHVPRL